MSEHSMRREGATTPSGSPDYDEILQNRLMTICLGIGFDERGANLQTENHVVQGIQRLGFVRNDQVAFKWLEKGNRPLPQHKGAHFVYHTKHLQDKHGQLVDVVLTIVCAGRGNEGKEDAAAFLEGMDRCEVAAYGGHGRYGTGLDFDYNFTADLHDEHGKPQRYRSYETLEDKLEHMAKAANRSIKEQYHHLVANKQLIIDGRNDGNIVINLHNYHGGEFGGMVMIDQLKADNDIRRFAKHGFAKKYRTWLFQGCRTWDYFHSLHEHSTAKAGGLDVFGTRRITNWANTASSLLTFVNGVLRRHTYAELLAALGKVNPPAKKDDGPSHAVDIHR